MVDERKLAPTEVVLTLRRMPDGRLQPFINDEHVVGCVDVTVNSNGQTQLVQVVFHASFVAFETAKSVVIKNLN